MADSEMTRVLVLDPWPAFADALLADLHAIGLEARCAEAWSAVPRPTLVLAAADLLSLVPPDRLHDTVVVVDELTAPALRIYFGRQVRAVVDRHWPADRIVAVAVAAADGRSVIPSELLWELLASVPAPVDLDLTTEERSWLQAFAEGRSSAWVARQAHLSERQLYRRLHRVYDRLGVTNRSAAIAVLSRHS